MPNGGGFSTGSSYNYTGPAYERVTSLPNWMPTEGSNEQELMDQYRGTNAAFDTGAFDQASEAQQSRVLTTALNSGNNAAREYANRARQAGGSGMGAGLVKAQASTNAQATAGNMKLDQAKFDAAQREAAAGHATQIATTLGQLRDSYLKSLVSYATTEDSISAEYQAKQNALAATRRGTDPKLPFTVGSGLGRGSSDFTFKDWNDVNQFSDNHPNGSPYLGLGGYGYGGGAVNFGG